tara:strand:+ start:414 stop:980 length:567 start_codon:yes stop_codon:yes gene_type:complete
MDEILPYSLEDMCGEHLKFRNFIECGDTFNKNEVDNLPQSEKTYDALINLAKLVVDPVIKEFGEINLTYAFAGPELTKLIKGRIAPSLDQHASYELNTRGKRVCGRGGAAVDFNINNIGSFFLSRWIVHNCSYDRLYYYGNKRPIHVSSGPENSRSVVVMKRSIVSSKLIPRNYTGKKFLELERDPLG